MIDRERIIAGLEDQRRDRLALANDDNDSIFTYDAQVLEEAIALLRAELCEDAVSRGEILDEINARIADFITYGDYVHLFDYVDTLPSVTPKAQEPVNVRMFTKPQTVEYSEPVLYYGACSECNCGLLKHWVACPMCGKAVKWK